MHSEKKVVLLCQHFFPEMISTGMHMTELAVALTRQGWKIDVICAQPSVLTENQSVPKFLVYEGVAVHRVSTIGNHRGRLASRALFGISYMLMSFFKAWRLSQNYDGLIITTNPPFLGLAGLFLRFFTSKEYLMIAYDIYPDTAVQAGVLRKNSLLAWAWERISRSIFTGASITIVIGRDMLQRVSEKIKPSHRNRIRRVTNWSDEKCVYPMPKQNNGFRKESNPHDYFIVQYSGTMARIHNLEPLIEAAEILQKERILFQMIGGGHKKAFLESAAKQKRLQNVQFLPFQPLNKLAEVLSAANLSVVCLASQFTGLSVPSKAYGIMAAGVPLLGFMDEESEIALTIREADCGVVLSHPTGVSVAENILTLMNDRERLHEMGVNAYKRFKAHHTLSRVVKEYDSALLEAFSLA